MGAFGFKVARGRRWRRTAAMFLAALLAGCGSGKKPPPAGPPIDVELAQSVAAAETAYARGALPEAATLYRRALTRARAMDDAAQIAGTAYNAAACLVAAGDYAAALPLLREAQDETLRTGGNTADVLLIEAKVARYQDRPADALALCEQVLTGSGSKPSDVHHMQIHLIRGQVACAAGDVAVATTELQAARATPPAAGASKTSAGVVDLEAAIELKKGNARAAVALYDQEESLCREAQLYRDMSRATARAAGAARSANDVPGAARRYYRAARGAVSQHDAASAGKWLALARSAATDSGDAELIARVQALAAEISTMQAPAIGMAP